VQILEQDRRGGLIFKGLVVDVVFALVFDLLLGWGPRCWGRRRRGSRRLGELSSSRKNHGAHNGDGRDSVVGPIRNMQRSASCLSSFLNWRTRQAMYSRKPGAFHRATR